MALAPGVLAGWAVKASFAAVPAVTLNELEVAVPPTPAALAAQRVAAGLVDGEAAEGGHAADGLHGGGAQQLAAAGPEAIASVTLAVHRR